MHDMSVDTILDQIESLLNENDVGRATSLIKEYRNEISLSNKRFQSLLVTLYSKRRKKEETIDQTQNQTIHYGNQRHIGLLLDKIQKARETGDFQTAKDYCHEWLSIEPDSERAKEIAEVVETALVEKRNHLVILNRSKFFTELKMYQKALDLLELIPQDSEYSGTAKSMTDEINLLIKKESSEIEASKILDEVTRLLEKDHLDSAFQILNGVSDDNSNEIRMIRSKIERAIENRKTEEELVARLWDTLRKKDLNKSRIWLGMISDLNPGSGVFDDLRKKLDHQLFENLTNGLIIT